MYWIILIVLAALILLTIIVTIVTIVKEKNEYKHYELDAEYGADDDEEDYDDRPVKKSRKSEKSPAPAKKKRWKIILLDMNTDEEYDFIFYDTVGIGRTTKDVAYEKFLPIPDDRKISKVHCSIIRNKDKLYLKDEGSRNSTYLNGRKVQKPILIQKEDIISIGETDLEVIKVLREAD